MKLPPQLADYVPVKTRIHTMRQEHADWSIVTTVEQVDGHWIARAWIKDGDDHPIASAGAYEKASKAFDYEKAETSAVGRALTFAGYTDSVELSREELERSETVTEQRQSRQTAPPRPVKPAPAGTAQERVTAVIENRPGNGDHKALWRDYVTVLARTTIEADEMTKQDWLNITLGKKIDEMTKQELQVAAAKAEGDLSGE